MDEIVKNAARFATKQAVNAFQVLMAGERQKVTPTTSRNVFQRDLYNLWHVKINLFSLSLHEITVGVTVSFRKGRVVGSFLK